MLVNAPSAHIARKRRLKTFTPKILYTYRSINDRLRDTLSNKRIWVSNPLSFNDPFDCDLPVIKESSPEKALASVTPLLDGLPHITQVKIIEAAQQGKIFCGGEILAGWRNLMAKTGIACFCEVPDDILMWSHYAEKHQGVCLGFEKMQHRFDVQRVEYSEDLPRVELSDLFSATDLESMKKFILTKSTHWEYEREWRFFHASPQFTGDDDPKRSIAFYPDELRRVIFGCRVSQDRKEEIKAILQDWPTKIHFYEAKIHASRFKLRLCPM